jgi:hypothetical protein
MMTPLDLYLLPLHATRAWFDFLRTAPETLVQPILPGWNFGNIYNVSEANSSAPHTEQEVVRRHSYGRQLGRVIDALTVLAQDVDEARLSPAERKRLSDFQELAHEIEDIKEEEAARRIHRIARELASLKDKGSPLYPWAVQLLEPLVRKS